MNVFRPFKSTRPFASLAPAVFRGLPYQALLDLNPIILVPSINDARAEGKLWQDAAMTTPATTADDPVGVVEDFSGNGYHFTSAGAARPLLKQDGSGNWYLDFDGVDDFFVVTGFDLTATSKLTVFVAYKKDDNSGIQLLIETSADWNSEYPALAVYANDSSGAVSFGVRDADRFTMSDTAAISPGTAVVISGQIDMTLATNEVTDLRVSGISDNTRTINNNTTGPLGSTNMYIGGRGGAGLFLDGAIYSLGIYTDMLSIQSIETVEAYLAANSGVAL